MAEGLGDNTGAGLPPKLDLRKSGVLKPTPVSAGTGPAPALVPTPAPVAAVAPAPAPAFAPKPAAPAAVNIQSIGASAESDPGISVAEKSQTMRLVLPEEKPAVEPAAPDAGASKPVAPLKPVPSFKLAGASVLAPKPLPVPTTVRPAGAPIPGVKPAPIIATGVPSAGEGLSGTMRLVIPEASTAPVNPAEAKTLIQKPAGGPAIIPVSVPAGFSPKDPKRETSKIPLDAAKPSPVGAAAAGPKTIRISPAKPVAAPAASAAGDLEDDKRKTSRISLESALAPGDGAAASGAPKTIKIKKPSDSSTVKAVKGPSIKAAIDDLSKTAKLDEVSGDESGPLTRKKTIKVKRPTQRPGVQATVQAPRPGTGAAAPIGTPQAATTGVVAAGAPAVTSFQQVEERMNPFFPICGIIAALVLLVAIYMFCAQALGPNISLTELSYWPTGPDIPWPGKLKGYLLQ